MSRIGFGVSEAVSGRSTCQGCRERIEKGAPRAWVLHWYTGDKDFYHPGCVIEKMGSGLLSAGRSVVASYEHGDPDDHAGAVLTLDAEILNLDTSAGRG